MSQVSLSAAEEQPPEDPPSSQQEDVTIDLGELASLDELPTNPAGEYALTFSDETEPVGDQAYAPDESEATLVGRELQRGKYRLLALRPAPTDDAAQVGVSYVALHTDLQRRLLMRYLPLDTQISVEERGEATTQFLREVRALARLAHPSLPRVHDYFCEGDACYVVMDELAERTLADVLVEAAQVGCSPALPPLEIARLGLELARALAYLHQQHPPIVLGGLRPQDIALPQDGPAQLISLGALTLVASATSHSLPDFLSIPTLPLPGEAAASLPSTDEAAVPAVSPDEPAAATAPAPLPQLEHWSPHTDVFSLGLVLCELAGGPEVIARVLERQRLQEQAVQEETPPISLALAAVIEMAAHADPECRFQSASALENALERAYDVERRIARLEQAPRLENGQSDEAAISWETEPLEDQLALATRHIPIYRGAGAEPRSVACWKCGGRNQPGTLFCRVCGARQPVLAGVAPRATPVGRRRVSRPPAITRRLYDGDDWSEWHNDEEDAWARPRRSRPTSERLATGVTRAPGSMRRISRPTPPPDKGRRLLWALVWVCFGMAILLGSATSIVAYLALR